VILRPRRLAAAFAAGALSEREKLHYLLVWAALGLLAPSRFEAGATWNGARLAFMTGGLLISIVGLLACFEANTRGDGRSFVERYVCLSVPLGILTYVLYYVLYYGLGLAGLAAGLVERDASNWSRDWMSLVSSFGALILYFLWMRASILRAAGARAA